MSVLLNPYRFGTSVIDGTSGSVDSGILAAVHFSVSGGVVTIVGQKNVASVTRLVAGVFRVAFSSAVANTNYGVMATARPPAIAADAVMLAQPNRDSTSSRNSYSTAQVDIATQAANGSTNTSDPSLCSVVVYDPSAISGSNYLAAASWTVSGTTVTLQRQTNVASMSRHAAGVYRTTFTSALATADYSEFAMSRYGDSAGVSLPLSGQNRNTTIPSNLHSTTALDLCTGRLNAAASSNFDTARGSVLIGRPNVAPRGTLARVRFSVSGGVATIIESYNVSSVTVQAAGDYRINFTTAVSDASYAVFCSGKWANFTDDDTPIVCANNNSSTPRDTYSTTAVDIAVKNYSNGSFDPDIVNVWVLKPWLM